MVDKEIVKFSLKKLIVPEDIKQQLSRVGGKFNPYSAEEVFFKVKVQVDKFHCHSTLVSSVGSQSMKLKEDLDIDISSGIKYLSVSLIAVLGSS